VALQELADAWKQRTGVAVSIEAAGGVDVAKRLRAGETFDLVFLGSDALDSVIAAGDAIAASKTDLFRSVVAAAIRKGAVKPDISTETALVEAVRSARSIGYSTGPSGLALAALFGRWGIAAEIKPRIVVPKPGIPVGSLVASGEVELGFQQLSEFIHVEGIEILGGLPPPAEIVTIFSGALCAKGANAADAKAFLDFAASPDATEAKLKQGLQPAK
jgi:molybdate transport system substrate-binding protein